MKIYPLITAKRKLEELLMWPFVMAGKRWAANHPLTKEYDIFFFFPIYGLGGAEKVNADIVNCMKDKEVVLFFTRTSYDDTMLHFFKKNFLTIHDISKYTDNKWRYWDNFFFRGVCAYYINTQLNAPVVFNGQCNFAYKLLPHLKKKVRKIELIHNSNKHFAWITFPYIPFIDQRVMITESIVTGHAKYYKEIGLNTSYTNRIRKIVNKIDEPECGSGPRETYPQMLNFYYAGRGGSQKRVWLLLKAIEQCLALQLPINFHLAGNFKNELPETLLKQITFHGEIKGGSDMTAFHQKMDVLMMTSAYEGFPMVMMEAMINGVVPIATAVDGVPEHITDAYNGLLIHNAKDEAGVVQQLVQHAVFLCNNRGKMRAMSQHAYTYAKDTFSGETFCRSYREVMGF